MVSDRDIYFFDLQGFLHLRGALSGNEVAALNDGIDAIPPLESGQWHGSIQAHDYGTNDGLNLQQIYEAGEPFEALIDHPSWYERVRHFVGGEGTFDCYHGPVFIDEAFATLRGPGEAIGVHNGGHLGLMRCQFRVLHGRFHCGQINILIALSDIHEGDGPTMLIPGSHKSNFAHPDYDDFVMAPGRSVDGMEGAIELFMDAGDALLFVDAISHGSAKRTNPAMRRTIVYRYGPSWGSYRHAYRPSPELLARLAPQRRKIVQPVDPVEPPH
ncbi:MAG: hypothetical protein CMJ18_22180 [Phycisphaeraceae bacterium]|nr:hypothetical protein [Phycisphaeraceae bacterium]